MFKEIGDNEALNRAEQCIVLAEYARKKAIMKQQAEDKDRREKELKTKKRKKIIILGVLLAFALVAAYFVITKIVYPDEKYKKVVLLQQEGKYDEAIAEFSLLPNYRDSNIQIMETKYLKADTLTKMEDYAAAVKVYSEIQNYKDVKSLLKNNHQLAEAVADAVDAKYSIGNYVTFGTYPQGESAHSREEVTPTPIEWLVIDRDGEKALLISKYLLDRQVYHESQVSVTWEKCSLRKWLNDTFINKAFTLNEQQSFILSNVDNGRESNDGSEGTKTQDKVFLLSYSEADQYFNVTVDNENNMDSRAAPTIYAKYFGTNSW